MPPPAWSWRRAPRILKEAVALATKSVDSGEAEGRLDRLIAVSNA